MITPPPAAADAVRLGTGINGLDEILEGGLPPRRLYLVEGRAGAGKTTLALQFLIEGAKRGEPALFVTLSESAEELADVASSHGWSLDGVTIVELSNHGAADEVDTTLYEPAEVELGGRMHEILAAVDRLKPTRVVIDSCSELRLLAQTALRYRREILALKDRLIASHSTILLLDPPQPQSAEMEMPLETLVHGVLQLEQLAPLYGAERRRLRVVKLRGHRYRGGYHDFVIRRGGLQVFPRLVAAGHHAPYEREVVRSGLPGLDALLGGGPQRGTSLLLMGPSGCVLVIDDSVDAAQTIAQALELAGHRVHVATDGRSGLEKARALRPDVIVCDIGLPDIDGYEIARTIRRDGTLRAVRLVALSGCAQPDDLRQASDAGFDVHLAKPSSLEALLASLLG